MTTNNILATYLILFAFYFLFDMALALLNMRFVKQHAQEMPEFFKGHIDEDTYSKSVDYTLTKGRFGIISSFYSAALLLVIILFGYFGKLDAVLQGFALGAYTEGVAYVLVLSFILSLFQVPFELYSTFIIEERFGFNKSTLKLWFSDKVKGMLVGLIILVPMLYGLFWFMDSAGALWWLYAFLFITGLQLLVMYIYPVLIAPLFNKFEPLEEGALKQAIFDLADKVGFKTSGVFLMDGSRRSGHGNAYFTGFGKNKRIVLFDTLVDTLSTEQTVAVLAHEMGHQKKQHIKKSLLLSLVIMFVAFWILSLLINYLPFFEAFGFERISYHGALIIFAFAFEPVTYFLTPLFSMLSRRFEYQADSFAVKAVQSAGDLSGALLNLSKKNLSNFTPHPLYSFFHYSHPTLHERIVAMNKVAF
jgi:STE24 endopeptidase